MLDDDDAMGGFACAGASDVRNHVATVYVGPDLIR